uniref:Uncharacterized protein n=1 Tax=Schistosoma curassoni TaxID=6186 RepID=A0A183L0R9_9TREM
MFYRLKQTFFVSVCLTSGIEIIHRLFSLTDKMSLDITVY